jgi:sulfate/thiosulfate transport system substrate-binding protein
MTSWQQTPQVSNSRFGARLLEALAIGLVLLAAMAIAAKNHQPHAEIQLLNVSYDPTRELYREINQRFVERYERETGHRVVVRQSHGGSSRQARAVISGEQSADVVTLGLRSDIEALRKRGLVHDGWGSRLPNNSQPYYSTIVFVVRRGNPFGIHDWPDLVRLPSLEIVTPDPKSSGNGKLAALAAWGAIVSRGGSEAEARVYLTALYDHTSFLEPGARGAATAFAIEKLGDVHLTWENEALREVSESKGDLELVYPKVSILAEPVVAWVDANVVKNKTEVPARAYLEFLFTDAAQEIIAKYGYRPYKPDILKLHRDRFPELNLFPITAIAKDWEDAQQRFFADNGIIETVYRPKPR